MSEFGPHDYLAPMVRATLEGSQFETLAMDHDNQNLVDSACTNYRLAIDRLNEAVRIGKPFRHPDAAALAQHVREISSRIEYLRGSCRAGRERDGRMTAGGGGGGSPDDGSAGLPISHHISPVQLTMQADHCKPHGLHRPMASSSPRSNSPNDSVSRSSGGAAGGSTHGSLSTAADLHDASSHAATTGPAANGVTPTHTLLGAAGVGAVASYLTLGVVCGGPLALVGGAAAAGYLSQQDTAAGKVVRKTGEVTAGTVAHISQNSPGGALESVKNVGGKVVSKVKEVDDNLDVSGKVRTLGKNSYEAAKDLNDRHNVTGKISVGGGFVVLGEVGEVECFLECAEF